MDTRNMIKASIVHLKIPMRRPFVHAKSVRHTAESIILMLQRDSLCGMGECIPRDYVTGETIESVMTLLQSVDLSYIFQLISFDSLYHAVNSLSELHANSYGVYALTNNARCIIEMALLDYIGHYFNTNISSIIQQFYESISPHREPKHILTSQVCDLALPIHEFVKDRGPFHCIKIKLNNNLADNMHKITYLRSTLPNTIPIIADVNMAWSMDEVLEQAAALKPYDITYYEEPLKKGSWDDYQQLKSRYHVPIMLDESICTMADAKKAVASHACDAFNIRVPKCGGIINTMAIIQFAKQHGIAFQLGTQVAETGPLILLERQLAGAIQGYFTYEAGQHDRYFDDYIISPMPIIDRQLNIAPIIHGRGLGAVMTPHYEKYVNKKIIWENKRWTVCK